MSIEQIDHETLAFFNRPAADVVADIAERVYIVDTPKALFPEGRAKTLVIGGEHGGERFKITLAEPYSEDDASQVWQGSRLERIKGLQPGGIVAFTFRSGTLSFIKTTNGDNVLLHGLVDLTSGDQLVKPTQVSKKLGLSHGEEGQLTVRQDEIIFSKR